MKPRFKLGHTWIKKRHRSDSYIFRHASVIIQYRSNILIQNNAFDSVFVSEWFVPPVLKYDCFQVMGVGKYFHWKRATCNQAQIQTCLNGLSGSNTCAWVAFFKMYQRYDCVVGVEISRNIAKNMAAVALSPCVARPPAGMVMTMLVKRGLVFPEEELRLPAPW